MKNKAELVNAVEIVVSQWLDKCPGQPLVLRADPLSGTVEATIGLGSKRALSGAQAAEVLGISYNKFKAHGFYGLKRGMDNKFSRLVVERLRDSMR